MQHMLPVNVLIALAFITSLSTQTGVHDATSLVRTEVEKVQGTETQNKEEAAELRRQEIEAKRLEIEQKNAAKRAAVTEKLSGKRAEQCKAKQDQINRMLDERSEAARRHYETFATIQDRLQTYAENQKLDIKYDSALQIIIPGAQDKALAAVQALETTQFDCENVDASAPGAIIKDQIAATKLALSEYRDAIKEYAEAIKAAASASEATPTEQNSEEQGDLSE
jgi:hypothetical protein